MSWPEMDHATPLASEQGEKSAGDPIGGKGILQQGGTPWGTGDCTDNKKNNFQKVDGPSRPGKTDYMQS
jgi:hypothetical protein